MCQMKSYDCVIVGTGAAGYNAAWRLHQNGFKNFAVLTENREFGTSRNTGSDKQTYYKMNLCQDMPDSPYAMAVDLFNGKCVDGDIAYAEAANSVRSFLNLVELGVPFPTNELGEYVGYKTDHDPCARATSVGPLTSKMMTECLEKAVMTAGVPIIDHKQVISIIKDNESVAGLLTLDLDKLENPEECFLLIKTPQVIWCTGGPAGMYADSVYPACHTGSTGVAFEAGVIGKNLTEWQYGLASVNPRWNVSGTYMQVLPRFVSVDAQGNEHEFLSEYYPDVPALLSAVFKKGYQWPFDSRKAVDGSSVVDLLVYRETALKGRRVYLDYTKNPIGLQTLPFEQMEEEGKVYLQKAGATFGTPIDRLLHMNAPAYNLYLSKGLDLKKDMLEIALCSQHNNGGLDVDMWWQTNIKGFFAAGEVAATHGVYRPGGSALNAGQVGSLRSAQYVSAHPLQAVSDEMFMTLATPVLQKHRNLIASVLSHQNNANMLLQKQRKMMSRVGGAIRNGEEISMALQMTSELFASFGDSVGIKSVSELPIMYRLRDTLMCQRLYLEAMSDYIKRGGLSRGSAIYSDKNGQVAKNLESVFRYSLDSGKMNEMVQLMQYKNDEVVSSVRSVRPLPQAGGFFENVWRTYRQNKNIAYLDGEKQS